MKKSIPHLRRLSLLGFSLLALAAPLSLHAQPAPAQLDRIAALVEEGKISEARVRTETLLEVFPDDAQLKQMSALLAERAKDSPPPPPDNPALDRIRSALAGPGTQPSAPPVFPSARADSAASTGSALAALDRLEIQTVLAGAQQALQIGDPAQRTTRLRELLTRPIPETALSSTQPEWLTFWQSRLVAALETDDLTYGWQAAHALKRLDALNNPDPQLGKLVVAANLKGWLTMDRQTYLEETKRRAVLTQRKAIWAGVFASPANHKLTITNPLAPTFKEWSYISHAGGNYTAVTFTSVIPGETKNTFSDESSGWRERVTHQSSNTLDSAAFNADYTELRVVYRNSQYGTQTKTFRLNENTSPPQVADEAKVIYKKAL